MNRRFATLALVALVAALTLSACGGGASTPAPAPAGKTFNVEQSEFKFEPNAFAAKVGEEITFKITNKGSLEHNFVVFDPSGKELARTTVAVGASGSLTVKPAVAGAYMIDCDIAGHREAGMVATLTVGP